MPFTSLKTAPPPHSIAVASCLSSITSAIAGALTAIFSGIARILNSIVSAIATAFIAVFNCIGDVLCCRCGGGRRRTRKV
ncbi:hypothetical protein IE81DRAFT_347461 [Ceraceosorus guamensis]|uniref:Uncharacterized protein n=1 Tax=Ceraceosorus guamensis TaxID=1522189 RepID=A0A316VYE6_9BASI|nr:hypothetical protein IE81DRAFT_347461 [Ceraceosorus guamensis]PWN42354.1 hypothetical protein IE81DRAFT_347461 [Ceraceosorus guamensis]